MRGPSTGDTLTLPVGNYLSDALRNYVSENPSDLRNFMSADTEDQTREARRSATVGFQKSACPSDRVIWVSCGIPKVGHLR
jgi:hypothetical protein